MKDLTPSEKFEILSSIRTYMEREIQDVIKHTKPSPDTLRMFETFGEKMKEIQDHLKKQDEDFLEFKKEIQEKLDGYPLIRNAVIGAIVFICMGVFSTIGAMMYWFFGKIKIM